MVISMHAGPWAGAALIGTYGQAVFLVGGRGGRGELGGVGGGQLQTVALHRMGLWDIGQKSLQGQALLLGQLVPGHHAPHKVHLGGEGGQSV